ncbi:AraC family transcriptional regulator [Streptomyces litchfieldiae]|uniref:AraC family transcriptional regulator n=1 Tax=Streptomyces litchfieldiae TaxID=3075543 RepID=A0ABU2MZH2_9ACTN|nr:AraC family transcriptional regulator [Streptomyces sp. DSM 44938]MDT0347042.1 AraC family transcriptional regulator [Streptomyces sp. DSM 44938]
MDVLSDAVAAMRTGRPHAGRRRMPTRWRVRAEPTPGAGFHVVLQGACWVLADGEDEPVRLGPGDALLLPHGSGHLLADSLDSPDPRGAAAPPLSTLPDCADPHTVMLCGAYLLDRARPHPLLAELPPVIHLPTRVGRHPSLRGAIDLLGAELAGPPRPGADGVLPALLDTLLLYLLRAWYEERAQEEPGTGWASALRDPAVSAALRAIHREPGRSWTVEALGAESGLSRAPFARRFAALVGRPPLAYLTWWRMTLAARLLRDSEAPVRSVAERVGYSSEFAFAKAFKREFGLAPGRYRRS